MLCQTLAWRFDVVNNQDLKTIEEEEKVPCQLCTALDHFDHSLHISWNCMNIWVTGGNQGNQGEKKGNQTEIQIRVIHVHCTSKWQNI